MIVLTAFLCYTTPPLGNNRACEQPISLCGPANLGSNLGRINVGVT